MHVLARIGFTLAGLALLAPAAAQAGMPAFGPSKTKASKSSKLCGECQRAKLLFDKGVNVSPPPALPPGTPVRNGNCTRCGRPAVVVSGPLTPSRAIPPSGGMMPGAMANEAPGRASTIEEVNFASNGVDPTPIGVVQPRLMTAMPVPSGAPRGAMDPAVMAASATVSEPVGMAKTNRPHIVSHLLGFSEYGRERKERKERVSRESHAMIPYGQAPEAIHDVPASVVFGKNGR